MKYVLGCFAFFVSAVSFADYSLMIPQGKFSFSEVQALNIKHYEMVRAGNVTRLKSLQADGYTCNIVASQVYQCSKFGKTLQLPSSLQQKITQEVANYSVTFLDLVGSPHLENEGEVLQEWSVSQSVLVGEKTYKTYRYQIVQGLHKITPTVLDVMEPMTWVVDSTEQIVEPRSYEVRDSSSSWTRYFVGLVLKK